MKEKTLQPARAKTTTTPTPFAAVGPVRPKRRFKKETQLAEPARVIIPIALEPPARARFARSRQPFQVWKAPSHHGRPAERSRPVKLNGLVELARSYARSMAPTILAQARRLKNVSWPRITRIFAD
jgi:hypothetical protein